MSSSRKRVLSTFAAAAVVAASAFGANPAPASVDAARIVCGTFTGPSWKYSYLHKTGTVYQVGAEKVPCAFAKSWSTKLARTQIHGKIPASLPGPAGWRCYLMGIGALRYSKVTAAWGRCDKGSAAFIWVPKVA